MTTREQVNCILKTIFDHITLLQSKLPHINYNFQQFCYYFDNLNRLCQDVQLLLVNYKNHLVKDSEGYIKLNVESSNYIQKNLLSDLREILDDYKIDINEENIFDEFGEIYDIIN